MRDGRKEVFRMDEERLRELYKWERIVYGREAAKRRRQLRKTKKYHLWEYLYNRLEEREWKKDAVLEEIYLLIDRIHGWGYSYQAVCAKDALYLFLEDKGKEVK
jgi:transposase